MKKLIILLLLIYSISVKATVYNISTQADFDNFTAAGKVGGDQILFERGKTFYGTLNITTSGSIGNPITYGAYGTGADPIITGFTTVTAWTETYEGSNIWESTSAVSGLNSCNMVTINGVNTAMGRTPNLGSYYTLQSHNANLSITSSDLTGTPDWIGAEVVIRKERWIWQVGQITSQTGSTISYTDEGTFIPQNGYGFFIQDDVKTLDVQNEWYYNPSTKKITVYSTTEPTNVKVASSEYVINITNINYVNIENLTLIGANTSVIYIFSGSNTNVSNCSINNAGLYGINFSYNDYSIFNGNTIKNSGWSAIGTSNYNTHMTITNNVIDSTCMILGIGLKHTPGAINVSDENSLIQYNTVSNSGYNGIFPTMGVGDVRNNFVTNSCLNRADGGGIYTSGAHTNLVIDGNIVSNTIGYLGGVSDGSELSMGIYLDMPSTNVTVSNNTTFDNTTAGIFVNYDSQNITVTGNTSYNNASQYRMNDYRATESFSNIALSNNIFVAKTPDQFSMELRAGAAYNIINGFITSTNNNIYARPIGTTNSLYIGQQSTYSDPYLTVAQWQTFSGKDANSTISPYSIEAENELLMIYNPTQSDSIVSLPAKYKDLNGVSSYSVTLQPYTSKILFMDFSVSNLIRPITKNGKYLRSSTGKIIMTR